MFSGTFIGGRCTPMPWLSATLVFEKGSIMQLLAKFCFLIAEPGELQAYIMSALFKQEKKVWLALCFHTAM